MRLTRKKAIELSIELWEWLAETGSGEKSEWPEWGNYGEVIYLADCFLCEYGNRNINPKNIEDKYWTECGACPYHKKFGRCCNDNTPFWLWAEEEEIEPRKKYALLFLAQLKELLDGKDTVA